MSMSAVNDGRFGMLILKEMIPASLLETTIVEMSGAAGFSPVESVYVVVLAVAAFGAAPTAAGSATHARAISPRSPDALSRPTGAQATGASAPRQERDMPAFFGRARRSPRSRPERLR